jgi:hypothetical protein
MHQVGRRALATVMASVKLIGDLVHARSAASAQRDAVRFALPGGGYQVLNGETVSGSVSIAVLANAYQVHTVDFYIDDPDKSRAPAHVDRRAPFEFADADGVFDTRHLSNGDHVLTVVKHRRNGSEVTAHVSFHVSNVRSNTGGSPDGEVLAS